MPAFSNPRREKAAQLRADGAGIGEAYREAGYKGKPSVATNFFKLPEMQARVAEIQANRWAGEHKARDIATKKAGLEESWIIERTK